MKLGLVTIVASWATFIAVGTAQDRATIGTFSDEHGPVANAIVTFSTSDPIVFDAFEPAELVTTTTDKNGRFRVRLRVGRSYSAWAVQPHDVELPARSKVYEGIQAGNVVELAVAERAVGRELILDEVGTLGEGPFTLHLRCDARHGPVWKLPIAADGRVALPPLPAGNRVARVVDAKGNVVAQVLSFVGRKAFFRQRATATLQLRDDAGKPVVGARVQLLVEARVSGSEPRFGAGRVLPARIELPLSDESGQVVASVARGDVFCSARKGEALARVAGAAGGLAVKDGVLDTNFNNPIKLEERPIELVVKQRPQLRGRLLDGGQPLADVGLYCFGKVILRSADGNTHVSTSHASTVRTASDGSFVVEDLPRPVGTIVIGLEPKVAAEPVLVRVRDAVPEQPLAFDLSRFATTTLQCTVASGPPGNLRVSLWSHREAEPTVLVGDRAGRVRLRAEPGEWLVFATDGEHAAVRLLALEAAANHTGSLAMEPLATMKGRIVGPDGKPRGGLPFNMSGVMWPGLTDPTPDEQWLRGLADDINRSLTSGTRSALDGSFQLRFVPFAGFQFFGWFRDVKERVTLAPDETLQLTTKN